MSARDGVEHFRLRGFGHGIFRGEQFKDALGGGARLDDLVLQPREVFQRLVNVDDARGAVAGNPSGLGRSPDERMR